MNAYPVKKDDGPGVPEALPRTLAFVRDRLGPERVDQLWIFPPLVRGRRERGLVVAACYANGTDDDGDRRAVHTVTYAAERSGLKLEFDPLITEEGLTPTDRLPRVISGVLRRSALDLGEPRDVELGGEPAAFDALLAEFDPSLFEEVEA